MTPLRRGLLFPAVLMEAVTGIVTLLPRVTVDVVTKEWSATNNL
jgi:hypothetical protein